MRGMAKDYNLSEWTIRNVVKNNLGARSLARTHRFLLTNRLKAPYIGSLQKAALDFKEKYAQVSNSRNDRYITKKRSKDVPHHIKTIQKSKHPAQTLVFRLVASNGPKMPPVFLE